jgi:archaellum biogenesis ATPase FlaH
MEEVQSTFSFTPAFQVSVLSYLFHDATLFRRFTKYIQVSYFTEFQFRDIMEISMKFFAKYDEVPSKTSLLNELNTHCIRTNGRTTIVDYQNYVNEIYEFTFNEEYVKDEILQFIKIQAVYAGLKQAYMTMHDGKKVLDIVTESVSIGNKIVFDGGYDYKKEIKGRIERLKKGIRTPNQIPIGMNDIDRITKGGVGSGELGVVIGQTGIGKSIFLCNVAIGACMIGKKVFYATMESGVEPLAGRIDSQVSKKPSEEMRLKTDKLTAAIMQLPGELKMKEFPQAATTPTDISNYVNDLIANGYEPDIIILDYIGIMAPERRFKDLRHAIQNICQNIVGKIAKRYKVPVWSAHQSSEVVQETDIGNLQAQPQKQRGNKVIGISGIAEAKVALSSECDFLISLNQNAVERSQVPEGLRIHVMKNRLGPNGGTFHMNIDKKRFIISEAATINCPTGQ